MRLPVPKEISGWHRRCSVCWEIVNAAKTEVLRQHPGHKMYPVTFVTLWEWIRLKVGR